MKPFTRFPTRALYDRRLNKTDLMILLAICMHLNSEDTCWPSQSTIAEFARLGRQWVNRRISRMVQLGWLRKKGRGANGLRGTCEYTVLNAEIPSAFRRGTAQKSPAKAVAYIATSAVVPVATSGVASETTRKELDSKNNCGRAKQAAGADAPSDLSFGEARDREEAKAYLGPQELSETTYAEIRAHWRKILGPKAWRDGLIARLLRRGNALYAANWIELRAVYERHAHLLTKSGARRLIDLESGRNINLSEGPSGD